MRARTGSVFALVLCCGGLGCVGAEGITRKAVPAALDESLAFLEDPESQRRIEQLMLDPRVQHAARELSKTLVDGVFEAATEPERQLALREASSQYIAAVSAAAARSLRADLGPAAAEAARMAVAGVLDSGLSPETRRNAQALVQELMHTTVDGLTRAASRGLKEHLGPAMRAVIEDELGPSLKTVLARDLAPTLREVLVDELTPAFGVVAHETTRQIVLGAHDGLEELRVRRRAGEFEVTLWNRLDRLLNKGIAVSAIVAWVLGAIVLVLAILFGRAILLRRRLDEERLRSERMLLGVMRGLQQGSDKPDIEAFLAHLHERDPSFGDQTYLDELARRVSQTSGRPSRPRRRL